MEVPFTEDELNRSKRDDLYERAFEAAISAFNRKTELLRSVAFPVIKQVYETQAEMYDNILIPISDGRLIYNVRVDLKEAYEAKQRAWCASLKNSFSSTTSTTHGKKISVSSMNSSTLFATYLTNKRIRS